MIFWEAMRRGKRQVPRDVGVGARLEGFRQGRVEGRELGRGMPFPRAFGVHARFHVKHSVEEACRGQGRGINGNCRETSQCFGDSATMRQVNVAHTKPQSLRAKWEM